MNNRQLALIAGGSYLVIFVTAIYANFFVIESLWLDPLGTVKDESLHVRLGVMAFLVAAVFDTVVAWALYHIYKDNILSTLSTYFRILHAGVMGIALFALLQVLNQTEAEGILTLVDIFNTVWLIGLFFFGAHLILLGRIVKHIKIIPYVMMAAGVMYMVNTTAHFMMVNYDDYANLFLTMVAIPSIFGEMAFAIWLLVKGGKQTK